MNLEAIRSYVIPARTHAYDHRDAILYALGLGYGSDPTDEDQVAFVFEQGLKVVPSMSNTIAHPGFWLNDPVLEIDWVKVLHAEQSFEIRKPLDAAAELRGDYAITSVEDKGADKGALLTVAKTLTDVPSGDVLAVVKQIIFLRGDGGQGGFGYPEAAPGPLPDREPDVVVELSTLPQQALIYRLSGDVNPLHASPAVARNAGFDRPILHGLCTMGIATRALIQGVCDGRTEALASQYVRFSKPVFPGETIRTEIFREGDTLRFRCLSVERNLVVLDRGHATLRV